MAAVSTRFAEPPRQLWLDVDRPIQVRPRPAASVRTKTETSPPLNPQMELRMVVLPPMPFAPVLTPAGPVTPAVDQEPTPFGEWLLTQVKCLGLVGELAKTARLDRQFPKSGGVDDVRAHFSVVGADGDAFEALEDAEREYDRAMR